MWMSQHVVEQREFFQTLNDTDVQETIWSLLETSSMTKIGHHQFCNWRILCLFDLRFNLNIELSDFILDQFHDLQLLNDALVRIPLACNWELARVMLYRVSRFDLCVMHKLSLSNSCRKHLYDILLTTFATMTDNSHLNLLLRLLEVTSNESRIVIVDKLSRETGHVSTFCKSLQGIFESKCMLDAVPHINTIMYDVREHGHHFTLTVITNYPFVKLNNNISDDPTCVTRMPFRHRDCKVHTLAKRVFGIHYNNCTFGAYKPRPFLLAFDQTSGDLVWGQLIHNDGCNKLVMNDEAIAVVPCNESPHKEAYVYDIYSGRQTAMLIKPDLDSQLSPTMDTWTMRTFSTMDCTDTVARRVKLHRDGRAPGDLKQFAFGVSLYWDNVLHVDFFSQNELEVRDCVAYKIKDDSLAVLCLRDESMMLTLYKLREHGAYLQHMWMVPFTLHDVTFIALDVRGCVLKHRDGLFFVNFQTPDNKNVTLSIPIWAHMRAMFNVVWIWDRTTKKLTRVTPQGVTHVANVAHMASMVHVDEQHVFVS